MTHYFRNELGNRVIAIDGDRVTEFKLLFTMGDEMTTKDLIVNSSSTPVVEYVATTEDTNSVDTKSVKTKKKSKSEMTLEEKKEAKKAYMKEWYAKKRGEKVEDKPSKRVTTGTGNSGVMNEPNLKLIQEYGKSAINAIINCKKDGMTVDEIDQDQPKGVAHLTYGQIEMLYDLVVVL